MRLHPMHPAAWVIDNVTRSGWTVLDLLAFTRASTLLLVSRPGESLQVVLKAGFGSNHVLQALDDTDRKAAYGFYWYHQMTDTERGLARRDFRTEINTAQRASTAPRVVPVLDTGNTDDLDWYTMPYYRDGNFRDILTAVDSHKHPDSTAAVGILADVADGVAALHDLGIVHRDLYQENILINAGHGLVTDFGAARHGSEPQGPAGRRPEVHWPPEYATEYATATSSADVYSLAVLVYRVLSGDLPRVHGHMRLPQSSLADAVVAGLALDPRHRPSMPELGRALRAASTPGRLSAPQGH